MTAELRGIRAGAEHFLRRLFPNTGTSLSPSRTVLSIGSTPSTTATQNLLEKTKLAKEYLTVVEEIEEHFELEVHAGVYTVNDLQQIATRARPEHSPSVPNETLFSYDDIGFRILAEVVSVYPQDSGRGQKPEALISAGNIALGGREACKDYPGWGVVTPWPSKADAHYDFEGSKTGWIVGRISQEHGILSWEGPVEDFRELEVGQNVSSNVH